MMPESNLEQLIAAWLDGRISASDSELLQQHLRESSESRSRFLSMAELDASLRQVAGGDIPSGFDAEKSVAVPLPTPSPLSILGGNLMKFAVAAAFVFGVGLSAYQFGKRDSASSSVATISSSPKEQTISGHASLRRVAAIQWTDNGRAFREGDVLPAGVLEFDAGVAEIDFFCGATVIVEGPAKLNLESDWSVRLLDGRLRANVPPAARGFVVKVADSEIIDLGTEFALDVTPSNAWVQVVDGEVELKGGSHDGQHLLTGQGQSLLGADLDEDSFKDLSTIGDVQRRHESEQHGRFEKWKSSSLELRNDKRLIAYYPIAEHNAERYVSNAAPTGSQRDGKLVGLVERDQGRFGQQSTSFGFGRPGSRLRVRIDGEYQKFTFACWARVDSLEHMYNALFMGDGYENGEPHWQIKNDGRLMFSVMVDDTPGSGRGKAPDARLHRIYYTKPFWDVSMSGKWLHLAAAYDPQARVVRQYVNGTEVGHEEIEDSFFVKSLRIGPAEIGNWGQPLRKSPGFAVRNLNGAIDELAIFNDSLSAEEIQSLYENGKPFGN